MVRLHILLLFYAATALNLSITSSAQIKIYATAGVNLEGAAENRTLGSNGLVEVQYIGQCAGSKISISKSGELKLNSYANNCYATHITDASGNWDVSRLRITGADSLNIPLNINFEITGSQDLVSSPGILCNASIASSLVNFRAYTSNGEIQTYAYLQHRNGFPEYTWITGFDSTDAWVEVTPVIKYGINAANFIKLEKSWTDKFLRNLYMASTDALTANDAIVENKMIQLLSGGIPIGDFSEYSQTLTKNQGKLINAIIYLLKTGVDLLPVKYDWFFDYSPVSVGFDVKFKHKYTKAVKISTAKSDYVHVYMYTQAGTIPQCETRAETNFNNTAKISSITIADGFDQRLLVGRDLRVYFDDDTFIPVKFDVITGTENNIDEEIQVFPNPVNNFLKINLARSRHIKSVMLLNSLGIQVYGKVIDQVTDSAYLDNLSSLPAGQYFVKIFLEKATITKSVILQ